MSLIKGQRIRFLIARNTPGPDIWLVTQASEAGATIERELTHPRLVEIKDDDGAVVRSFYARTSGDRQQISVNSHVHIISEEPKDAPKAAMKYKCDNCELESDGVPAKDLSMRLTPGCEYTDMECPRCGALAYPIKTDDDNDNEES